MAWGQGWSVPRASCGLWPIPQTCFSMASSCGSAPLLCFSRSCRSSSSPHPTQLQVPMPRRNGPPGARPASGPKVNDLVSRYFCTCPKSHPVPQLPLGRCSLQLLSECFCSVPSSVPPCPSHSRWSWSAGYYLRPRPVWGSSKESGFLSWGGTGELKALS